MQPAYPITILNVQYYQELHDKNFHFDIYQLPVMTRLKHLHNHMVKYNASKATRESDNYFPDSLACILSMANALGVSITSVNYEMSIAVGAFSEYEKCYHPDGITSMIDREIGAMAKILEGHDHSEHIHYKGRLGQHLATLLHLLHNYHACTWGDDNFVKGWFIRLRGVQQNNIFYAFKATEMGKVPLVASFERIFSSKLKYHD